MDGYVIMNEYNTKALDPEANVQGRTWNTWDPSPVQVADVIRSSLGTRQVAFLSLLGARVRIFPLIYGNNWPLFVSPPSECQQTTYSHVYACKTECKLTSIRAATTRENGGGIPSFASPIEAYTAVHLFSMSRLAR